MHDLRKWLASAAFVFSPLAAVTAQESGAHLGVTEPIQDATLTSTAIGVIDKIHFQEGEVIKQGQVILELRKRQQELEVTRHQIDTETKRKDFERTKSLFDRTGSVSREELDQKDAAFRTAQAELELAQADLEERTIRAPFTGIVTDLFSLTSGESVEIGSQVVRLVDVSRFVFVGSVPKNLADTLAKGERVDVEVGEPGQIVTATGAVSFVSAVADPGSGLTKIKAICDNSVRKIRPGMPARMKLTTATTAAANHAN